MINISLNDLNRSNAYVKTLQIIEDTCEQYDMNNHFGIISMANQEIIDYLSSFYNDFSVDFRLDMDNQEMSITYSAMESIFEHLSIYDSDRKLIQTLTDNLELSSDNKQVSLIFHVKPKYTIKRKISVKTTQTVHI